MNMETSLIPDRRRLLSELNRKILSAQNNNTLLALIIVHLKYLREINNEFGYEIADQLLQELFNKLESLLQPGDFIVRIGDNEFALVLSNLNGTGQGIIAANRILGLCDNPMEISGQLINIKLAAGVSIYPDHALDSEVLFKHADTAVTYARRNQDGYMIYSDIHDHDGTTTYVMRTELEEATINDKLEFFYQPKIHLKDRTIAGFEVLARWTSNTLGEVKPDTFINLAEATGLIAPLTVKAITIALRQCKDILAINSNYSIALNISAQILNDPDITRLIMNTISIWCTNPSQLILEITEGAIMSNPEASLNSLGQLHNSGIKISIDDFGTGYSSLSYLKKLPVDEIKIDKSFVLNMNEDKGSANIVKSVIDLAHNFNLNTVAEGVENEEILNELERMGCDVAQGFYIARPMPHDELNPWIMNWGN